MPPLHIALPLRLATATHFCLVLMRSAEDAENKPLLAKAPTIVFDAETGLAVPMVGIWMVYLTIFMDTLASTISSPVLPYYARVFNATNAQIGYLFAAWSFTSTIFVPLLGTLADRIGRRTVCSCKMPIHLS